VMQGDLKNSKAQLEVTTGQLENMMKVSFRVSVSVRAEVSFFPSLPSFLG
jgi:hypothetical protein